MGLLLFLFIYLKEKENDIMKKSNFIKGIATTFKKHSPEILTGIGIAGMITTTVLAVKATPKALCLIEKAEDHGIGITSKEVDQDWEYRPLTPIETVKVAWKPYIPAAITGVTSIACLIGASSVSARRNAALATAYNLSRTALAEYKEKVVETIGEVKEKEIRDKIAKDKVEKKPSSKNEVIITERGDTLCFDAISGRYFKSDMMAIERAVNRLNKKLLSTDYVSLNEFYDEIDLPPVRLGEELGWNIFRDDLVEVNFSSQLSEEGKPCIVVDYLVAPRYDYSKLM